MTPATFDPASDPFNDTDALFGGLGLEWFFFDPDDDVVLRKKPSE